MTEKKASGGFASPSQDEIDTYVGTLLTMLNEGAQREAAARARVASLSARVKQLEDERAAREPAPTIAPLDQPAASPKTSR